MPDPLWHDVPLPGPQLHRSLSPALPRGVFEQDANATGEDVEQLVPVGVALSPVGWSLGQERRSDRHPIHPRGRPRNVLDALSGAITMDGHRDADRSNDWVMVPSVRVDYFFFFIFDFLSGFVSNTQRYGTALRPSASRKLPKLLLLSQKP